MKELSKTGLFVLCFVCLKFQMTRFLHVPGFHTQVFISKWSSSSLKTQRKHGIEVHFTETKSPNTQKIFTKWLCFIIKIPNSLNTSADLRNATTVFYYLMSLLDILQDTQPVGVVVNCCRTVDQGKALLKFVDAISEKTLRSTIVMTAGM